MTDRIRSVLEAHPLIAEKGFYAGRVICGGCHTVLGDPGRHLLEVLAAELDPFYTPVEPVRLGPVKAPGQLESTIGWER